MARCDVQQADDIRIFFMRFFHLVSKKLLAHELVKRLEEQDVKTGKQSFINWAILFPI
jgi:hypothetical protein